MSDTGEKRLKVAVIMTVHNRKETTLRCLDSLQSVWTNSGKPVDLEVYITDDGCTDGTASAISSRQYIFSIYLIQGGGSLYWNGGMILAWKSALSRGSYSGYLWLNDDTKMLSGYFEDLIHANEYCKQQFGICGIYVGSTKDAVTGEFTYGGFDYVSKWTLLDKFILPDGKSFKPCEAAHGNITYVSSNVVEKQGLFYPGYHHGGADHDYTYLAHKAGFPVLVLPHYSGECTNDHPKDGRLPVFFELPLKERIKRLNLHNTLIFNKRCFPWRFPIIALVGYGKALFPRIYHLLYLRFRGAMWHK